MEIEQRCSELPSPGYPKQDELRSAIENAVRTALPGRLRDRDHFQFRRAWQECWRPRRTQHQEHHQRRQRQKGGVGKSTVAACLTYGLKHYGAQVGLLDADVYGPSIPHMLECCGRPPGVIERKTPDGQVVQRMVPQERDGIQLMSMGFLVKEEQAVIWRGPMLHNGAAAIPAANRVGRSRLSGHRPAARNGRRLADAFTAFGLSGAVVVCTPQKVAQLDAVKAIAMFRQLNIPILGVVENMAGEVFGRGGAKAMAEQHNVPFLGEIPIEATVRMKGDEGRIAELYAEDSPVREPLLNVCRNVATECAQKC